MKYKMFMDRVISYFMKISLNWLSEFLNIELNSKFIEPVLTDIGLEVESIQKYELFKISHPVRYNFKIS